MSGGPGRARAVEAVRRPGPRGRPVSEPAQHSGAGVWPADTRGAARPSWSPSVRPGRAPPAGGLAQRQLDEPCGHLVGVDRLDPEAGRRRCHRHRCQPPYTAEDVVVELGWRARSSMASRSRPPDARSGAWPSGRWCFGPPRTSQPPSVPGWTPAKAAASARSSQGLNGTPGAGLRFLLAASASAAKAVASWAVRSTRTTVARRCAGSARHNQGGPAPPGRDRPGLKRSAPQLRQSAPRTRPGDAFTPIPLQRGRGSGHAWIATLTRRWSESGQVGRAGGPGSCPARSLRPTVCSPAAGRSPAAADRQAWPSVSAWDPRRVQRRHDAERLPQTGTGWPGDTITSAISSHRSAACVASVTRNSAVTCQFAGRAPHLLRARHSGSRSVSISAP